MMVQGSEGRRGAAEETTFMTSAECSAVSEDMFSLSHCDSGVGEQINSFSEQEVQDVLPTPKLVLVGACRSGPAEAEGLIDSNTPPASPATPSSSSAAEYTNREIETTEEWNSSLMKMRLLQHEEREKEMPTPTEKKMMWDSLNYISQKLGSLQTTVNSCAKILAETLPAPCTPPPPIAGIHQGSAAAGCMMITNQEYLQTLRNIKSEPAYGASLHHIKQEDISSSFLSSAGCPSPSGEVHIKKEPDSQQERGPSLLILANVACTAKKDATDIDDVDSGLSGQSNSSDCYKDAPTTSASSSAERINQGIVCISKRPFQHRYGTDSSDLSQELDNFNGMDCFGGFNHNRLALPKPPGSDTSSASETSEAERRAARKTRKVRKIKEPLPCTYCNKLFNNQSSLRQHESFHRPDRPFNCDHESCGKAYKTRSELNRHLVVHSGEKQHFCKLCGKRFLRKQYLKTHLIRHHETGITMVTPSADFNKTNEPVPAPVIVASSFVSKTEPLTWRCQLDACYRIFVSKEDLKKHLRSYHSKKRANKTR